MGGVLQIAKYHYFIGEGINFIGDGIGCLCRSSENCSFIFMLTLTTWQAWADDRSNISQCSKM